MQETLSYTEENIFSDLPAENPSLIPGNEGIMASAGTGKTFSLAMRYITLLQAGVSPGRILACTFTKKAAGEIFDKIASELIQLARSDEKVQEKVKQFPLLEKGAFDSRKACHILGKLLKNKEKLQISTLDSFFVNIIRAFPLECGIYGELAITEENDTGNRVHALLELLRTSSPEDKKEIMETVKEASYGENNKTIYGTLEKLIFALYDLYLSCPEKEFWCSEILKKSLPAEFFCNREKLAKICSSYGERIDSWLAGYGMNKNTANLSLYFKVLAEEAFTAEENPKVSETAEKLWEYLPKNTPTFPLSILEENGSLSFPYNRKEYLLEGSLYEDTAHLMRHILYCNADRIIRRNEALWHLLHKFNKKYALLVRSAGKIAFSDIPYLLRPSEESKAAGLALPFSGREGIEERLDEKTDHYLIDEFQDTSDNQWEAISRLVDEAITDADFSRSFFYVGDIKQSIYQWRQGNPGLFDMILNKYPEKEYAQRGIRKSTLLKSYRSNEYVLDMVNTLFMDPAHILNVPDFDGEEKLLVHNAIKEMHYEKHFPSSSAAKQKGYSCYYQLPPCGTGETKKNMEELKYRKIYELLCSLNPFQGEHSFSTGVLFRKNDTAMEFAEWINTFVEEDRKKGKNIQLPVSLDSRLQVQDSIPCMIAYYLLYGVAHPGENFHEKMFEMLEFGNEKLNETILAQRLSYPIFPDLSPLESLTKSVRNDLADGGFERFFRRYMDAFKKELAPFDLRRLSALVTVARKYDLQGVSDIDDFLALAYEEAGKEISLRNTVQCMTYHKSKGLAFDIVIMPDLNGESMASVKLHNGMYLDKDPYTFAPKFLTAFPKSLYTENLPVFRDFAKKLKAANAYESCCMLYVGMTRAKHALYLFGHEKGKDSHSINMASLCSAIFSNSGKIPRTIEQNMSCLWEIGDPLWLEEERRLLKEKKERENAEKSLPSDLVSINRDLTEFYLKGLEKTPSGTILFPAMENYLTIAPPPSDHTQKEGNTFSSGRKIFRNNFMLSSSAMETGTKVHELFCQIAFYNGEEEETFLLHTFGEKVLKSEAGKICLQALRSKEISRALKHPGSFSASLMREKPFLLPDRSSGHYISGIFDRLVAEYDEAGNCEGAIVIDYKSDREEEEEIFLQRYSGQLNIYRKGASALLKIPEKKVKCLILALRSGKVVEVPFA